MVTSREDDANQRDMLRDGLIGHNQGLRQLYMTNAEFRAGVETLVRVVPTFVRLMATDAEERARHVSAMWIAEQNLVARRFDE